MKSRLKEDEYTSERKMERTVITSSEKLNNLLKIT